MDFDANKTPNEITKEGAFETTCLRYSSVTGEWDKKSRKEFHQLKDTDQKFSCSVYYDVRAPTYLVK